MKMSRRGFVQGAVAATAAFPLAAQMKAMAASCPFKLAVINDEISPDFDHACYVAAHDFGLSFIELRTLWGTTLASLSAKQIEDALKILAKYKLKVTDLASPLFKVDLPGAASGKNQQKRDQFHANFGYDEQDKLLEVLLGLTKTFSTDRIRCFDFWRIPDAKPFRAEINRKLSEAAAKCAKHDVILLLENEMACNTGTGKEALETLAAVPNKNFMLNWDPGNSASFADDVAFPDDYEKLPKKRIGHVHCKNVTHTKNPKNPFEWQPVDVGLVDWVGQFKALRRDEYRHAVSLETHWHGAPAANGMDVPEASTRVSMKGLKDCLAKAGVGC